MSVAMSLVSCCFVRRIFQSGHEAVFIPKVTRAFSSFTGEKEPDLLGLDFCS